MKNNNANPQDYMVKYSRENKQVNTLVSNSCHIFWLVAVKNNRPYVIELCYADEDGVEWIKDYLDKFDDEIVACKDGPAAFKYAELIQATRIAS